MVKYSEFEKIFQEFFDSCPSISGKDSENICKIKKKIVRRKYMDEV